MNDALTDYTVETDGGSLDAGIQSQYLNDFGFFPRQ
jgi:hypothetical protein